MGSARVGPADYVRRVRNGWQARPYVRGTRVSLGIYPTYEAAARMVRRYLAGKADAQPLPKFVTRSRRYPGRYEWHVRQPGLNAAAQTTYATPQAAAAAVLLFLQRLEGAMFASAALGDRK
jgi:hypothetical protein